ncbi:MAG: redoxin domain-containing protein [Nitrosomonadales bacterium]|nr:redoxin domain-containing protein [Nitrosomonadales bacterium]
MSMRRSLYLSLAVLMAGIFSSVPVMAGSHIAAPLSGATQWLNSKPLNNEMLRGKVVLVDFWTYTCSNCLNALPHVKAWDEKYRARGLVVIGVQTPEFDVEKNQQNVEQAIKRLGVTYPVAMDNQYTIWNAYGNRFWPAQYLIDAQGRLRYQHYGEGAYQEIEDRILALLDEAQQGASAVRH